AGSHHLNHLLTKEVLKDKDAYEIVTLEKANEKAYEKVFA
ncbi:UDP-3-O-[3-hydroxymyristoyl] N-acetylglucosamine deacetylase, partial [Campylobacter coli]|nr:UDP-3-O-[3-hydroxymyristoyl] N-acetylglucosamine deacetylase [Campylobacter coli]